jgi:hypothetical protein
VYIKGTHPMKLYGPPLPLNMIGANPSSLLPRCEGNCDADSDCQTGLVCHIVTAAAPIAPITVNGVTHTRPSMG